MKDDTNETEIVPVKPLDEHQQKLVGLILDDIENGMTESDAAILNKSRATWSRWKQDHPELQDLVDEAKLKYKKKVITTVSINSVKSGIVGLEILRRRFPKEWNVPLKTDVKSGGKRIGGVIVLPSNGRDKPTE